MHFVSLALEPSEKSSNTVPTIILVVVIGVFAGSFFAFDDKILIRFWQILKWNVDIDLHSRACPKQILLRFAKLAPAENAHDALFDT